MSVLNEMKFVTQLPCWYGEQETQAKWEEYEEIASSLVDWLQVVTPRMLVRNLPTTYDELKVLVLL